VQRTLGDRLVLNETGQVSGGEYLRAVELDGPHIRRAVPPLIGRLLIFFSNSRLKREYILNAAIMRGTYFPPLRSPTAENVGIHRE